MADSECYLSEHDCNLLVRGFVRENIDQMPMDIVELFVLWFTIKIDIWDIGEFDETGISIDTANNIISRIKQINFFYFTGYGSHIISKVTKEKIWKVKVLEVDDDDGHNAKFVIGIVNIAYIDAVNDNNDCFCLDGHGYAVDAYHGTTRSGHGLRTVDVFPDPLQKHDILSIEYRTIERENDFHGELAFGRNEGSAVIAFDNIELKNDEKYRLAVSLFGIESVQLLQ